MFILCISQKWNRFFLSCRLNITHNCQPLLVQKFSLLNFDLVVGNWQWCSWRFTAGFSLDRGAHFCKETKRKRKMPPTRPVSVPLGTRTIVTSNTCAGPPPTPALVYHKCRCGCWSHARAHGRAHTRLLALPALDRVRVGGERERDKAIGRGRRDRIRTRTSTGQRVKHIE